MKEEHSIEYFLNNPDFVRWVNISDPKLNQYWSDFMAQNPQSRDNLWQARQLIQSFNLSGEKPSEETKNEVLDNIMDRIEKKSGRSEKSADRSDRNFFTGRLIRSAAAILIFFMLLYSLYQFGIWDSTIEAERVTATFSRKSPSGTKLKSRLPDGTMVWLNAESEIQYSENTEKGIRQVRLLGEAFFDVREDKDRPFIVETNLFSVRAIGTSFNVKTYQNNSEQSVALASGKVMVEYLPGQHHAIELDPGQKAVLRAGSDTFEINSFDLEEECGWRNGILVFNKSSYDDVKRKLERWYGVTINADSVVTGNWKVSARFENMSLERVLEHLSYTKKFDFTIEHEQVELFSNLNIDNMPMDKEPPDQ